MRVYAVWSYNQYYPTGPRDLVGLFANEEDAFELAKEIEGETDYVTVTAEYVRTGIEEDDDDDD